MNYDKFKNAGNATKTSKTSGSRSRLNKKKTGAVISLLMYPIFYGLWVWENKQWSMASNEFVWSSDIWYLLFCATIMVMMYSDKQIKICKVSYINHIGYLCFFGTDSVFAWVNSLDNYLIKNFVKIYGFEDVNTLFPILLISTIALICVVYYLFSVIAVRVRQS